MRENFRDLGFGNGKEMESCGDPSYRRENENENENEIVRVTNEKSSEIKKKHNCYFFHAQRRHEPLPRATTKTKTKTKMLCFFFYLESLI